MTASLYANLVVTSASQYDPETLGSRRRYRPTLETRVAPVELKRTEHGELICAPCNTISLQYVGKHPDPKFSDDDLYQCEVCQKYWFDPHILD